MEISKLRQVMQDRRLTIEAKALYAYYFYLKDELEHITKQKVMDDLGFSEHRYRVWVQSLIQAGYINPDTTVLASILLW